jgi:hypothetical protein
VNALDWMTDPGLFGNVFSGPSWEGARALVASIYALPMTAEQLAIYTECTRRSLPPSAPFREVWITSGRRSGKSILTAFLAIYTALRRNWREVLAPGEEARIPIFAVDRAQSSILFRFCRGLLAQSKMCEDLIVGETKHSISFSTGATIAIGTRDWRRSRGAASPMVALEETPVWPADEESANPDLELYRAVLPTQATLPDALLMSIGSAFSKHGLHYERTARFEGTEDPQVLVWRSTSLRMNPTLAPSGVVERALADDPEAGAAEWLSVERSDLSSYASADSVRAVCVPDRVELPSLGHGHSCFVDSAAGGACAYTAAIAHVSSETKKVVIDKLVILDPPLNTSHGGTRHVADVCKQYGVRKVHGDAFAGDWVATEFKKYGISYVRSPLVKTDLFIEALPVILGGACELPCPDSSPAGRRLFRELVGLQRRVGTGRTGRESITKMRGLGDDAANAVCGALALATRPIARGGGEATRMLGGSTHGGRVVPSGPPEPIIKPCTAVWVSGFCPACRSVHANI